MGSKYLHPTRFLMHRFAYLAVVVFLAAFFALPYGCMSYQLARPAPGDTSPDALRQLYNVRASVNEDSFFLTLTAEPLAVFYAGLGFLCAALLFRHLFSRRQNMLVAALPDTRIKDFARRSVCYLLYGLAPVALSLAAWAGAMAMNGLLSYVDWPRALIRFAAVLLTNVYGFAVGALACAMAGTVWTALLMGGLLAACVEATQYLWQQLACRYLQTMLNTNDWLKTYSPAMTLYKGLVSPETFRWLPGAAAAALFLAAALGLYRTRPVEAAGRPLAFRWLHDAAGAVMALAGGSLTGTLSLYTFPDSEWALLLGMALGAAAIWWASQALFLLGVKGSCRRWYIGAATVAVLLAGLGALHFDLMGYDGYLPGRGQVTAITYCGTGDGNDIEITLKDDRALDAAYAWAALMRDEVTAMPAGLMREGRWLSESMLTVTYQLDGKTVRRRYPNDTIRTQAQPYIKAVVESDDYRLSYMRGLMMDQPGRIEAITLYDQCPNYGVDKMEYFRRFGLLNYQTATAGDGRQMQVWLEALRADLCSRTLEDMQKTPILRMAVTGRYEENDRYFYQTVNIYDTDRHLLSAVAGDKGDDLREYLTGGFVNTDKAVVVRQTYDRAVAQMETDGQDYVVIQPAGSEIATPEQAAQWVSGALSQEAAWAYYMSNRRQTCRSLLFVYDRQELDLRAQSGQETPEDWTTLPQRQADGIYPDAVYYAGED